MMILGNKSGREMEATRLIIAET